MQSRIVWEYCTETPANILYTIQFFIPLTVFYFLKNVKKKAAGGGGKKVGSSLKPLCLWLYLLFILIR